MSKEYAFMPNLNRRSNWCDIVQNKYETVRNSRERYGNGKEERDFLALERFHFGERERIAT